MNKASTIHSSPAAHPSALSAIVARNLKRLRSHRGCSLERLAGLAGIDASDLDRMEAGRGEPTLESAWKIAHALAVPFAALLADSAPRGAVVMRKRSAKVLISEDLGLTTRALFPFEEDRRVEFYELRLAPHRAESFTPHAPGTVECLFVAEGTLEVTVGREPVKRVNEGDTICFPADLAHGYRNVTAMPATLYLVMTYRERAKP